jgi:hypothetical protein
MTTGVLGIPDPWIWMAYLLCLAATLLCVVHSILAGRKADEAGPTPADATWAKTEKQVEEEEE